MKNLINRLTRLEGKSFGQLKSMAGLTSEFETFKLKFEHIQGSPGAHPASIFRVSVDLVDAGYKGQWTSTPVRKLAISDFLIRKFKKGIMKFAKQNRGVEGTGSFHTIELGQAILERDCVEITSDNIFLWFIFSFPSRSGGGGKLDVQETLIMLQQELSAIVAYALRPENYSQRTIQALEKHIQCTEDWHAIQDKLKDAGLVAFIADKALLPRKSGKDDCPMESGVVPFESPKTLRVTFNLPGSRNITGLGIPAGVTVITGGGYHGKSTLLQSVTSGIYPKIPDDGRQYVVTRKDAVCIQAEEGRSVKGVNISPFIVSLPKGRKTDRFSTNDASGSTSQAASIIEAIETGAGTLFFDEDSCATNLLVRDEAIERILPLDREPIRPLVLSVRSLWKHHGISSVFVVGGLGAFLKQADTIIMMDDYCCYDISEKVRKEFGPVHDPAVKIVLPESLRALSNDNFDPGYLNKRMKKKVPVRIKPLRGAPRKLEYGMDLIEMDAIEQLEGIPQVRTIGLLLLLIREEMVNGKGEKRNVRQWIEWLDGLIKQKGIAALNQTYRGIHAMPPLWTVAAAINRARSLKLEE